MLSFIKIIGMNYILMKYRISVCWIEIKLKKSNFMRKSFLFFVLFCIGTCTSVLYAQSKKISGVVMDKDANMPLIGANVIVKGTTNGTESTASLLMPVMWLRFHSLEWRQKKKP